MAALTIVQRSTSGAFTLTNNTLTAADTLAYVTGAGQAITFNNATGSPVTVTLLGNAATTVTVPGIGAVSVSAGYPVVVPATGAKHLVLDTVYQYLAGTSVAVTGGVGVTVQVVSN